LLRAGAVIIESRYRGRIATWHISRSVVEPATFLARGGYVHPLEEHPMAYPPRNVEAAEPAATRTPGFAGHDAAAALHRTAAAKASPRPTPANEPAA
jgi:hypothetical protein